MGNDYFQLKQFLVRQDKTAMKVCTDACLFAAWVAEKMEDDKCKIETVLDIGSGTGLLSLMLAQKLEAKFDAVEIDEQAAQQTKENFEASPWSERMSVFNFPIQQLNPTSSYDLIISNPPFFADSLKSNSNSKNVSKHTVSLSFNDLIDVALRLLESAGKFCVMLPYTHFIKFERIAGEKQLHPLQKLDIQQTPLHPFFRTMCILTKEPPLETRYETGCIRDNDNRYTPYFQGLLKDYYLHL